jgi:hypothetical protein
VHLGYNLFDTKPSSGKEPNGSQEIGDLSKEILNKLDKPNLSSFLQMASKTSFIQKRDVLKGSLIRLQPEISASSISSLERRISNIELRLESLVQRMEVSDNSRNSCLTNLESLAMHVEMVKSQLKDITELVNNHRSVFAKKKAVVAQTEHSIDLSDSKSVTKTDITAPKSVLKLLPIVEARQLSQFVIVEPSSRKSVGKEANELRDLEPGDTTNDQISSALKSIDEVTFMVDDDMYLMDKNGNYLTDDAGERVKISKEEYSRAAAE